MFKEEILERSRKENQNKDLADLEIIKQAGLISSHVGLTGCVLISLLFYWIIKKPLISPWIIYFSMMATRSIVKYRKMHNHSELILVLLYSGMGILAILYFMIQILGAK
ncbi:MAG: DUF6442 family protein [Erysipelotrichaceae bacterium]|nr:DUF6442 family protein [Erysipelotrichaceae bacterium]